MFAKVAPELWNILPEIRICNQLTNYSILKRDWRYIYQYFTIQIKSCVISSMCRWWWWWWGKYAYSENNEYENIMMMVMMIIIIISSIIIHHHHYFFIFIIFTVCKHLCTSTHIIVVVDIYCMLLSLYK